MKRKIAAGGFAAALVALSLVAVAAAAKPDFSGKWVMDKAKSEGVPPTMEQTMTVTQTGDKIELETKIVAPQGERVIKDSYTADGKETDFSPQGAQGAMGKGKRTSKWSADGAALEVSETATLDGPNGPDEVSATRKWSLAADGKTLTIELVFSGEQGVQKTKRVFVKQ
jgi:predicted ribonuclease toxin of YeeF-YezG toxin-antitoxin module